jgi:membrane-bound lytic murein transglycosylase D
VRIQSRVDSEEGELTGVVFHEVKEGDTLWGLSRLYGLSVSKLLELNNLEPGTPIRPGQSLRVSAIEGEF